MTKTFAERCQLAQQLLPDAQYRAMRLADALTAAVNFGPLTNAAAAELRRLYAENQTLRQALEQSETAMKLALDALEVEANIYIGVDPEDGPPDAMVEAIITLRQVLADAALDKKADNARELGLSYEQSAQQEPVAWMSDRAVGFKRSEFGATPTVPLYTTPQPPAQPLTDAQIFDLAEPFGAFEYGDAQGHKRLAFARAIEAAHGITKGNT